MEATWDDLCNRADSISSPAWHEKVLHDREEWIKKGGEEFVDWNKEKKTYKIQQLKSRIILIILMEVLGVKQGAVLHFPGRRYVAKKNRNFCLQGWLDLESMGPYKC